MKVGKVKIATSELRRAFNLGQRAARKGAALRSNPYRPSSDGDLWRAWNRGFADPASSRVARHRRNLAKAVVERHGTTCWLCLRPITDELTLDHVLPRSKGGRGTRDNLRPAHAECNRKRGNGPPPELLLTAEMILSPGSKPNGRNSTEIEVRCEAREPDQRQKEPA